MTTSSPHFGRNSQFDVRPMNRRLALGAVASNASALAACGTGTRTQGSGNVVLDDGVMPLTPGYLVTYTQGQSTAFVRADFYHVAQRKEVELRPNAAIRVNGVKLELDPKEEMSYVGRPPAANQYTFEFVRSPNQIQRHTFELPELNVVSMDSDYDGIGLFRAKLRRSQLPARGVVSDGVSMAIRGPKGEARLNLHPTATQTELVFKMLEPSELPTGGAFEALIYRVQRISLAEVSDSKSGWVSLSNTYPFLLRIR